MEIKHIKPDIKKEFFLKQFRKKIRSLHETMPRKGDGWVISGFTHSGVYMRDIEGKAHYNTLKQILSI